MFTLWTLIEASLLILNAACILHEERFLARGTFQLQRYVVIAFQFDKFFDIHSGLGSQ